MALEQYDLLLALIGLAILGVTILPRFVSGHPVSVPLFYLVYGAAIFSLPLGLPEPNPLVYGTLTERLAELAVIIALMGAGLKLDREPGLRAWESTWRLLAITMPVTIALIAILGWWSLGFTIPAAVLLGAVLAPTDPVLATEVQVEGPEEGDENEPLPEAAGGRDEVRFALTSEAGLNDGLAFPFTYLAVSLALVGVAPSNWIGEWLLVDVGYRIATALFVALPLGWLIAKVLFYRPAHTPLAKSLLGLEALSGTLLVYGVTELVGGYGFIAVFVAAVVMRHYERQHEYYDALHDVSEKSEQLLMALLMILFGGAVAAAGLLDPLGLMDVLAIAAIVLVVRPLAGMIGFLGFDRSLDERLTISFFGIRGVGTFYYLAYGLNSAPFLQPERIWAVAGGVVVFSIVLHGITATPVVERWLDPTVDE
ncbi:cation:proton antiporter [Haloferacaceae archaeon DSL9]